MHFPKHTDEEIGIKKLSNETNAAHLVSANVRMGTQCDPPSIGPSFRGLS